MAVVIVIMLMLSLVQHGNGALAYPYCQVSKNTSPVPGAGAGTAPPLPTLADTFQLYMEANIVDQGYSLDVKEYFDDVNNRGALKMKESGTEIFMIYSYDTNEIFVGSTDNMVCTTGNLTGSDTHFIFGETSVDGTPHIFTTTGAMRFGSQFGEKYMGSTQVRGLKVDHWQSCLYWKAYDAYFTVDYYFTTQNWTTGLMLPQVPVRAWLQGVAKDTDGTLRSFEHYYEYFSYRPAIDDTTVFETPSGVVCLGRLITKDVPKLTGQYYYRQEIISPEIGLVQNVDVWYDSGYKLVRYDYRNTNPIAPYYSTNPTSEIHDYNTGVAYVIDKIAGNCTITSLENNTFDVSLNYSQHTQNPQYVEQMRSSLGLFYLDNSYTYEGKRTISGMLCDVFVSRRTDFVLGDGSAGPMNTTFEYYFLADEWTEISEPGVAVGWDVPVRLDITITDFGFHAIYNFYDFDEEHPSLDNFDITPCYTDDNMVEIQMIFPGGYGPVRKNKKYFELMARVGISELTQISPIRVQRSAIKHVGRIVLYFVTLLERPPSQAKFHKYSGQVLENNNDKAVPDVGDPDNCAFYCLSEDSFNCQSFDICPQKNICYLSKITADDGNLVDNDVCSHYTRNIGGSYSNEPALAESLAALKDLVYRNLMTVDIPLGNGETRTYRAVSIRQNILRSELSQSSQLTGADNIKQFFALRNYMYIGNADDIISQTSVDDCATACVDEDLFVCQSFVYRDSNGDCLLSKLHPSEHRSLIRRQNLNDLYIRNYLYKFTKVPGTVMLGQSNIIYQNIPYPNQCAMLCVGFNEFPCKSFEFCGDVNACVIGQTHMLDIPQANVQADASCDHYSRNYLDDFKFLKGRVVALKNNMIVEDVSLAKCSQICANQGDTCLGFDFCGNDSFCRLTSDSVKNVGQVTIEQSSYCDHYARQYYSDGSKVTGHSVRNYQDPSLKFTAGSMTGLAFAMLFISIILTVGGAWAWKRFRTSSTECSIDHKPM